MASDVDAEIKECRTTMTNTRIKVRLPLTLLAAAALTVVAAAPAFASDRAHWGFDEPGTPATAFDDSGNHNDGQNAHITGSGSGYTFNGTDSGITVPDSASLSPGAADFSFSVTLTTNLPAAGTDYDVLRKGLASTAGGEYKIEVQNVKGVAKAFCLVKDSAKHVASIKWAPAGGIANGAQHTITCTKSATGVTLNLDAYAPKTKNNPNGIGSVANNGSLFIGIKGATGGDEFSGTLYDARVS